MRLPFPYVVFFGDATDTAFAKTGLGVRDWARDKIVGALSLPGCTIETRLPPLSIGEAHEKGAKALLIGVSPIGGALPDHWKSTILEALSKGLDIISGLHTRLNDDADLASAASANGCTLFDIRVPPKTIPIATGKPRFGKRALMVGTDCAVGKKYAALALTDALKERGANATFRATGQTGIMIAGSGIPIDAVVSDFIAGAAEMLSPDADTDHWDIIEGQGALLHPAYSGVTLGLLHGSQPDAMVLCHDPRRRHINAYPDYPILDLPYLINLYDQLSAAGPKRGKVIGISLNTSHLQEAEANHLASDIAAQTGLPVMDPMRFGVSALAARLTRK